MAADTDTPAVTQQASFALDDDNDDDNADEADDGLLETPEVAETTLEHFGADVDHRDRKSRIVRPEPSTFGVDDRTVGDGADAGEQEQLFPNAPDDQQTLDGDQANTQSLFDANDTDQGTADTTDDDGATTPDHE